MIGRESRTPLLISQPPDVDQINREKAERILDRLRDIELPSSQQ